MKFKLTFEVVTDESAEHGEFARHGFITRNLSIPSKTHLPKNPAKFTLREALHFLLDRESAQPVIADSCPVSKNNPPRWFSYGGTYSPEHGGNVIVSLHLPRNVSASSAMRVAKLLCCYGIRTPQTQTP